MPETQSDLFLTMGLTPFEYGRIQELIGREPTLTELGMFAVMWSEHCGYKYSRNVLKTFKKYKEAMEGQGLENAGAVPLSGGWAITMKVESHNHPSAVEPYEGAATGVGGIIRDILTMGARPMALLNSLRFGPVTEGKANPEVVRRNRYLLDRVVQGIGGYGNCVGVPTVAGEVSFHPRYNGNPLVNAMCVGLVRVEDLTTAAASGPGNLVLYLGSSTGKDGIHGATFASESLDSESDAKRPNVQIGDPFAEKLLIEATLEALATGAVVAIQDMGAAGLTCGSIEMAAKGKVGMEIDLDLVPAREEGMSAYELMLSESQERMLAIVSEARSEEVIRVFSKWDLNAIPIGKVTSTGRVRVFRFGQLEVDLDPVHLADECPTYSTQPMIPDYHLAAQKFDPAKLPAVDAAPALLKLLSSPNIASKRWVYRQYDFEVRTETVVCPGEADAAVIAPRETPEGISIKIDGNSRWTFFDPLAGGQLAVIECARNIACTGAKPVAVTDGLNFGNPQEGHVFWQFEQAVHGISEAAEALGTPIISGNVSFYNESELGEVLPTPLIGMVGIIKDPSKAVRSGFPNEEGVRVGLLQHSVPVVQDGLGASEFLAEIHGIETGLPTPPHLKNEAKLCECLVNAAERGLILAAKDVSEGGLAVALAEMVLPNRVGIQIDLPMDAPSKESLLFGEQPGRVVVAYKDEADLQGLAMDFDQTFLPIGLVDQGANGMKLAWKGVEILDLEIEQLHQAFEGVFAAVFAD